MDVEEDAVVLRRHPNRWKLLPESIRVRLQDALVEVERLWISIADSSATKVMPSVAVVDTAWVTPDKQDTIPVTDGVLTINKTPMIGVWLSGPAAIYADEKTLRSLLLRGFLMALGSTRAYLVEAAKGEDLDSIPREGQDPFDPSYAGGQMEEAAHWFSNEDCELLEEELPESLVERTLQDWIQQGLPAITPDMEMISEGGISMPTPIRDHLFMIHGIEESGD